jgi:hypothetical protein
VTEPLTCAERSVEKMHVRFQRDEVLLDVGGYSGVAWRLRRHARFVVAVNLESPPNPSSLSR